MPHLTLLPRTVAAPRAAADDILASEERLLHEINWLRRSLDCVDYPMLCVAADRSVLVANRAAQDELGDASHPLKLVAGSLHVRDAGDVAPLQRAMRDALSMGLRRLVVLGEGATPLAVAVLPLPADEATGSTPAVAGGVLLVFGKRRLCESLSTDWFARERGLTAAETRVLQALTTGLRPKQIAQRQGVALSTVRTQVRNVRLKTGAQSIRELLAQVSTLPPMLNALRCAGA